MPTFWATCFEYFNNCLWVHGRNLTFKKVKFAYAIENLYMKSRRKTFDVLDIGAVSYNNNHNWHSSFK